MKVCGVKNSTGCSDPIKLFSKNLRNKRDKGMKKSGIYCIENLINNKKYIGQSVDIKNRW